MPQTIVGLDIGATAIRVARMQASLFRYEFLEYAEHPLPAHVELPWEQLVSNVLQVLFADRGLAAEKIIASLPGRYVSTRLLELPFSDRNKIAKSVPFELEGLIPLGLDEILLDYQVLATDSQGSKVLAVCTEKKLLEGHLSLLRDAGADPQALIPPPVALANLRKEILLGGSEPCAILDLGESETSLCLLHHGEMRYGRSWALGMAGLTKALEDNLRLLPGKARELKEKEATLQPPQTPGGDSQQEWTANILRRALDPILVGVRQSFLSASRLWDVGVEKVYLCGRGSHLAGLCPYLSQELGIDVSLLSLTGPVGNHPGFRANDASAAAVSLGLALHGVRETAASRLNLRTGEFTFVSQREELKKNLFSTGIMVGILLLLMVFKFGFQYHLRSQEYDRVTAQIDQMALEIFPDLQSLPAGAQRTSAMNARLETEKREANLFSPLAPGALSALDVLLEITKAVPQEVKIDVREFALDGDKIRIEAETDSYNSAELIKQNLLGSGMFVSADIPDIKDSLNQSTVKFNMTLQLAQRLF
ncbi:MAG: pilus assembly protein PilM [bacterium]